MPTRHIRIPETPIVFDGVASEVRPGPGCLRVVPHCFVAFPDCALEEHLVQFAVHLDIPGVRASLADEISLGMLQKWRSDLSLLDQSFKASNKGRRVKVEGCEHAFRFGVSAHERGILAEGEIAFPNFKWNKWKSNVMIAQEKPFPWGIKFAFFMHPESFRAAIASIDRTLSVLPSCVT